MSQSATMRAISIRQPWAWLILNAAKDIENRSWRTKFRGRVFIHASKHWTWSEHARVLASSGPARVWAPHAAESATWPRGGIVGSVEIVDCVSHHESPWFDHSGFGFVLRDPQLLPFFPCKGRLGFFEVPDYQEMSA